MDAQNRRARARRAEIFVIGLLAIALAIGLWQSYGVLLDGTSEADVP